MTDINSTIFLIATIIIVLVALLKHNRFLIPKFSNKRQLVEAINDVLPQTQCRDCGYDGCLPYAKAIVNNDCDINRCLPGGDKTIIQLANLTGNKIKPLYKDSAKSEINQLAIIDEEDCIGCVKCISACPVDAIIGAPKQMHSVINQYCTGCELCIAPCPVDCITMMTVN